MLGNARRLDNFARWIRVAFHVGPSPGHGWIIVSIGACCMTLVLLAVLQFSWIGEVNEAQRLTTTRTLDSSLRLFNRNLQLDVAHLLTVFRSNAGGPGLNRFSQLLEQYYLWQRSSAHGPAIRRMLVYRTPRRRPGDLTELSIESGQPLAVDWGEGLVDLRRELDGMGFRPGRGMPERWRESWIFFPRFMALARPIVDEAPLPHDEDSTVSHAGFLILQLDWDYVAERLLPQMMLEYFTGPRREPLYDVALSLDSDTYYMFRATDAAGSQAEANSQASLQAGFLLMRSADATGPSWLGAADASRPLLLSTSTVTPALARRGVTQRISLGLSPATLQVVGPQPPLDDPAPDFEATRPGAEPLLSADFPFAVERLRAFIAGEGPFNLVLSARHVDGSLQQVVSRQYLRSLSMAFGVLFVLAAAMGLAVLSARRAARLADLRMDFVAGVSHELRTPLSVIRMIGENMADGLLGSGKKARQYGGLLRDYAQRLSQMVEHTLQLATIESGHNTYELEILDVSEVVDGVLVDAQPLIEDAGFVLERIDADDLPDVQADEVALRQSLGNLLSNAIKYGHPGRWIRLETAVAETSGGREMQIRVHDRGTGVPPEELSSIFAPYYRGQKDGKVRIPGSGLGLKLAREMVRGMGGDLTVKSEVGQGSTFTVHLPL